MDVQNFGGRKIRTVAQERRRLSSKEEIEEELKAVRIADGAVPRVCRGNDMKCTGGESSHEDRKKGVNDESREMLDKRKRATRRSP